MKDGVRARYTLEFKQEAVRLVRGGETLASAARTLGVSAQSVDNWVKAEAAGRLRDVRGKDLTAEQMEIARLKAELSRVRMERDILKNSPGFGPPVRGRNGWCYAAGGGSRPLAYWWYGTPLKNVARGRLRT